MLKRKKKRWTITNLILLTIVTEYSLEKTKEEHKCGVGICQVAKISKHKCPLVTPKGGSYGFESSWPPNRTLNLEYFKTHIRMQGLVGLVFEPKKVFGISTVNKTKKVAILARQIPMPYDSLIQCLRFQKQKKNHQK